MSYQLIPFLLFLTATKEAPPIRNKAALTGSGVTVLETSGTYVKMTM
jgi:hypothetical protein